MLAIVSLGRAILGWPLRVQDVGKKMLVLNEDALALIPLVLVGMRLCRACMPLSMPSTSETLSCTG
jgi:hypothetical protein